MNFSVLLSVYVRENASWLEEAFNSIWCQQTLKPSQVVVVKDGPLTPALELVLKKWKKKLGEVITVVVLAENVGLGSALNQGIRVCNHNLIARMDTDDVSLPHRFEKQVRFMVHHPNIAVCGGAILEMDEAGMPIAQRTPPLEHAELVQFAKKRNPISHPTVMFRKGAVVAVNCYPDSYPEDYLLWVKLIQAGYNVANLSDVLVKMRIGDGFFNRRGWHFLKGELKVHRYMYTNKFISFAEFSVIALVKIVLRISPRITKQFMYKFGRRDTSLV